MFDHVSAIAGLARAGLAGVYEPALDAGFRQGLAAENVDGKRHAITWPTNSPPAAVDAVRALAAWFSEAR